MASNDGASCVKMMREYSHQPLLFREKTEVYSSEAFIKMKLADSGYGLVGVI